MLVPSRRITVICKLGFEIKEPVRVSKKGMLTIMECCEKHGRDDLYTYLTECQSADPVAVLVHSDTAVEISDKKRPGPKCDAADGVETPSTKRLQSSTAPFNWKVDCLLCASPAIVDTCHPQRQRVHRESTIQCCKEKGDLWASEVENCLQGCIDLVAAEVNLS